MRGYYWAAANTLQQLQVVPFRMLNVLTELMQSNRRFAGRVATFEEIEEGRSPQAALKLAVERDDVSQSHGPRPGTVQRQDVHAGAEHRLQEAVRLLVADEIQAGGSDAVAAVTHAVKCGRRMALGLAVREPYQRAERADLKSADRLNLNRVMPAQGVAHLAESIKLI